MLAEPAKIGAAVSDIDTPALIIDLDAFDRNLARMAAFAAEAGIRLRPHAKTHKCPAIARRQIAAGAVGQCVQKVGEAEAMALGGIKDILVTNQVVGDAKLRRLAALAQGKTIALCFDNAEQVEAASRIASEMGVELGGLVEIEVGMERCGIEPGRPARDLARRIADAPNLRFRGLQAYHGTAQHLASAAERREAVQQAADAVTATLDVLASEDLSCEIVGGGGTGTFRYEAESGLYNELQPGSYLFMDGEYAGLTGEDGRPYAAFEHSLFVLAGVMSLPAPDRAVLDAGWKSYSGEKGLPRVHGMEGLAVRSCADEHATLRLEPHAPHLRLGDTVRLIPGHCDPTINLHDWFVGVRDGVVEELWPITARGTSR